MRKKKVAFITAMSITAVTLASCGKAEQETTAKANTIPATEAVLQETEEPETETITTEEGDPIFPDYAEDYVKFTSIDPTTKYVIEDSQVYNNPNMTEGKLTAGGMEYYGNQLTVDATCNMDGVDYFRIKPNNQNLVLIIPASVLADELPSEEKETPPEDTSSNSDTTTSTTDNTDDNNSNNDTPDEITYDYIDMGDTEDIGFTEGQDNTDSWSDVDPAALEAAQNMILE